jgi:hypothetical protein
VPTPVTTSQFVTIFVTVAGPVITALAALVGSLSAQSRMRNNLKADLEILKALDEEDARTAMRAHIHASVRHLARSGVKSHCAFFAGLVFLALGGFLGWATSEVSNSWAVITGLPTRFWAVSTGLSSAFSFLLALWFFRNAFAPCTWGDKTHESAKDE